MQNAALVHYEGLKGLFIDRVLRYSMNHLDARRLKLPFIYSPCTYMVCTDSLNSVCVTMDTYVQIYPGSYRVYL